MAYSFADHARDFGEYRSEKKGGADPCKRQGEGAKRVPPIAMVGA